MPTTCCTTAGTEREVARYATPDELFARLATAAHLPGEAAPHLLLAERNILVDDPMAEMFAPFGDARHKIAGGDVSQSRDMYFGIYQALSTASTEVFRRLANDQARTEAIAAEVRNAFAQGRKVLVLTERTQHLDAIDAALGGLEPAPFVLHGRMPKKRRAELIARPDALPPDVPRVLLATGKLVGEGFDHPPLDTLVLAMPVSWKGTLQQYAGRLHREHASKIDVRIIDFVDAGHPALLRMWDKRQGAIGRRGIGSRPTPWVTSRDVV